LWSRSAGSAPSGNLEQTLKQEELLHKLLILKQHTP
jgi:hypothetical protein